MEALIIVVPLLYFAFLLLIGGTAGWPEEPVNPAWFFDVKPTPPTDPAPTAPHGKEER